VITFTILLIQLLLFFFLNTSTVIAANVFPGQNWLIKTPAEVGLSDVKLTEFSTRVGGTGVVIKDGYMVKTWGTATAHGGWASASKPVISTLLFFAVQEGKIPNVDYQIKNLGWNLSSKDQTLTFRHLGDMVSGYARGESPGAAWAYNDYAIKLYKLSLLEKVYGTSANNAAAVENLYIAANRLGPLQFQDGNLFVTASGTVRVNMTPRDFARIGWFWLNKGKWDTQQLLPQSYFDNYMKPGVSGSISRTSQGGNDYLGIGTDGGGSDQSAVGPGVYGFNWWFNAKKATGNEYLWPDAPLDTFSADGHFGKEVMVIIPSLNLVVAARGNWGNTFNLSGMNASLKILKDSFTGVSASPLPTQTNTQTPTPTQKPGDADGDGKVDGLDYVVWLNHYNQQAAGSGNGDFNNSGKVDGLDYVIWLNNYNI